MKKMHLAIICLFTGCTIFAQNIEVQPIPQQVSKQDGQINLPETYQLLGETEANPYAVQELKDLLGGKHPANTGLRIYIGEKGDKSIRKFTRQIPNQKEGYYLSINNKEIILAGNDERGTYYALQTLKQLLKDNQLPVIEIQDYPAIRYRGVVEGFYGTPWSHNARLRQLQFYGENKMNTYIYGPKDDPYHSSPNWRLPYPEKEAKQLQELVKVAQENEVDFVWAIHPGLVLGIIVYGVIVELAGVWFVTDKVRYTTGLLIGISLACGMAVNIATVLRDAVELYGEDNAKKKIVAKSLLRYAVVVIVFFVMMKWNLGNLITAFIGVLGLKVSAYLQPFTHRVIQKLQGRGDVSSDSEDNNFI